MLVQKRKPQLKVLHHPARTKHSFPALACRVCQFHCVSKCSHCGKTSWWRTLGFLFVYLITYWNKASTSIGSKNAKWFHININKTIYCRKDVDLRVHGVGISQFPCSKIQYWQGAGSNLHRKIDSRFADLECIGLNRSYFCQRSSRLPWQSFL